MKKSLWTIVILFGLVACGQIPVVPMEAAVTPTFTPWVAGTETALAVAATPTPWAEGTEMARATPTPWVEGTQLALASPTPPLLPTFAPPTAVRPADFSPVLYGKKYDANTFFLLLGGAARDGWLAPEVSALRFSGEATYSLHTLQQEYKYFFWGKTPALSPTCGSFTIGTDIDVNEAGMVAVLDGWDIVKRPVTELSADAQFYQDVVLAWLAGEEVASAQIGTLQVIRVDLEGDGTDEVFVSATHLDDSQHTTKVGDFSIVLMRKVVGNDVTTTLVVGDLYSSRDLELSYPRTYSLANFIDLNQDGVLEVVVDIQQWEGFGAIVYQVDGQNVTQALRAEC